MTQSLIEAWEINDRVNLYLIEHIEEDHLKDKATGKGRNVGEQFAHIHNTRLNWLKAIAPDTTFGIMKVDRPSATHKDLLIDSFQKSSKAISDVLKVGFEEGQIKNFKKSPVVFLSYLLAHEAHHRGQIILHLKLNKHHLDKKIRMDIWDSTKM